MARKTLVSLMTLAMLLGFAAAATWSQTGQPHGTPWTSHLPQVSANPSMLIASMQLPTGQQQVVTIDTTAHSMAVYHIQPDTGVIALKSVRKIDADFSLDEFNSADPTPTKVRNILGR